ncbi:DsbA family protein [Patescibacteria group bacterium]|nr:DsbA family protein [Patescibacteria group bacterium]
MHLLKTTEQTKNNLFENMPPKLSFIFGLVSGLAVVGLLGLLLTTTYLLTNKNKTEKITNSPNQPTANNTDTVGLNPPLQPVNITAKDTDYIRGNKNAAITLIEYSDLECPFCQRFHPSMLQLLQEYPEQVRWIYRHFPLSFHANAQKEAEAVECAGKLGGNDKFWLYLDTIFNRTTSNGTGFALDKLTPLAVEIGLPKDKFETCLESGEFAGKVQNDLQEGSSFGVSGTPTTFVNGQPVEGAVPYAQLKQIVDSLLEQ